MRAQSCLQIIENSPELSMYGYVSNYMYIKAQAKYKAPINTAWISSRELSHDVASGGDITHALRSINH